MKEVYITHAKRTAIGSFLGSLSTVKAALLGAEVIKAIIKDADIDPNIIDEVIMGQVITSGAGQNPARQALINAGLPIEIPATTINKVCGSGLQSVFFAANAILAGQANLVLAGGQENMSLGMHGAYLRKGSKFGEVKLTDFMMTDGLTDAFSGTAMGITAENIASKFNISKEAQNEYALKSQQKAAKAQVEGKFNNEIVPVLIRQKDNVITFNKDEGIRGNSTIETLSKLKAAFKSDGSVTAGNSSTINDGAACLLVASGEAIKQYNLKPIARIVSYASCGVDPAFMGTGPVPASKLALNKAGWKIDDLNLIEVNEAFAVQAEYVNRQMGWDIDKVNVNGGAIALGHPIGASGARVMVSLLNEMTRRKVHKGLATLCVGGGIGITICLELA